LLAVVAHVVIPGVSREQYDQVRSIVGWLDEAPVGGLSHVSWWEGDDNHNLDSWESEADFANFGENRLGPAMAQAGMEVERQVTFYPAHEVFLPRVVTITAT
jgi:hypothetical protein